MKVTVVTPSLNGMRYLDECIESVKIQRSENVDVEHMIVDGGSTDGTLKFARQRGCTVTTRKDDGIFDAINKGSFAAQGELLGFLGLRRHPASRGPRTGRADLRAEWSSLGRRRHPVARRPRHAAWRRRRSPELDHHADVSFARVVLHPAPGHLRELGNVP